MRPVCFHPMPGRATPWAFFRPGLPSPATASAQGAAALRPRAPGEAGRQRHRPPAPCRGHGGARPAGLPATTSSTRALTWPKTSSTTRSISPCVSTVRRCPRLAAGVRAGRAGRDGGRQPKRPARAARKREAARTPRERLEQEARDGRFLVARRTRSCGTPCRTSCSSGPRRTAVDRLHTLFQHTFGQSF